MARKCHCTAQEMLGIPLGRVTKIIAPWSLVSGMPSLASFPPFFSKILQPPGPASFQGWTVSALLMLHAASGFGTQAWKHQYLPPVRGPQWVVWRGVWCHSGAGFIDGCHHKWPQTWHLTKGVKPNRQHLWKLQGARYGPTSSSFQWALRVVWIRSMLTSLWPSVLYLCVQSSSNKNCNTECRLYLPLGGPHFELPIRWLSTNTVFTNKGTRWVCQLTWIGWGYFLSYYILDTWDKVHWGVWKRGSSGDLSLH